MIQSFKDKRTEDIYHGTNSKESRQLDSRLYKVVRRKLDYVNAAKTLLDLTVPPGNHLEALSGNLKGLHSIRINNQWRIIFRWSGSDACDVYIDDYH